MSRDMKMFMWVLAVFFGLSLVLSFVTMPDAKDLPREVYIPELTECDGKRVTVTGWLQNVVVSKGIRGSNFVSATLRDEPDEVKVFASFPVTNIAGERAIVQGVYHKQGRFGGFLQENYIVADVIVRDWDE